MAVIPFNRAAVMGQEIHYVEQAISQGHISGDGPFSQKCHAFLERELGVAKALLTTSCTHALEMAAILLDIRPGDEVIVPSFTFVTTINAFVMRGARPVFADIRPDTLNINERRVEDLITSRTKAIVVVHYAGVGCEMESIMGVADAHGIPVVEDNAHGLFGRYKDKYLGTFGCLATLSFHETKNFTCGEGGALLINDPGFIDRAEIIREKGTDRSRFFRGQVDKYSWVDLGSSYLPSDMAAAFLWGQFECRDLILSRRRSVWEHYGRLLASWAVEHSVRLPLVPDHCEHTCHLFYLVVPTLEERQALLEYLAQREIHAIFHYLPLHLSPMGLSLGGRKGDCPVSEEISDRLLRLPFYNNLSAEDIERVTDTVKGFYRERKPA